MSSGPPFGASFTRFSHLRMAFIPCPMLEMIWYIKLVCLAIIPTP
jgi:hypothetical protein